MKNLEHDDKKNIISMFKQNDESDEETVLFRSRDGLIEIEISKLSSIDFNLKFISLASRLKNERAALKINSEYFLSVLSMNTETIYIIHTGIDLINADSFELISLTAPTVIPVIPEKEDIRAGRKIYWYAAVAMVIIAVAIFVYFANRTESQLLDKTDQKIITDLTPGQKPIRESDTASTKIPEAVKKENTETQTSADDLFAANITLENFINRNNRSESEVEIISPSIGAQVQMPVTFNWMTANNNMILKFVILTNQNKPVYEKSISGKTLTIDKKLPAGLYYWKLESASNIEAMGKFIIR